MNALVKNISVFIAIVFLFFSCASNTNQTDMDAGSSEASGEDIDNLFGISEEEQSSSEEGDEDEVLRLLGISPEESADSQMPEASDQQSGEALKGEIEELEQQLSDKESQISTLKSEIASKDQKINELEANVGSTSAQPMRYSSASVSGDFQQDYQVALSEYQNRSYRQAISQFEALLARDSNNSLSDNCQYWIGECYYGLGNFNQAIVEFTKVFSFSNSNKSDDAQLKLGLCYWRLGDREKAREELERLISDYPRSEYIEKAEQYLSGL